MKNTAIIYNAIIENNLLTQEQCDAIIKKTGDLPFHTFKFWNDHGYQVKRGSHAVITCYLWKYTSKQKELTKEEKEELKKAYIFEGEEPPQTIENGNFYRVKAYLFDITQVKKRIKQEETKKETKEEEKQEEKQKETKEEEKQEEKQKETKRAKKSAPATDEKRLKALQDITKLAKKQPQEVFTKLLPYNNAYYTTDSHIAARAQGLKILTTTPATDEQKNLAAQLEKIFTDTINKNETTATAPDMETLNAIIKNARTQKTTPIVCINKKYYFNAKYVKKALQATKAKTIMLHDTETTHPAYIAGNGLEYVICPVRNTKQ